MNVVLGDNLGTNSIGKSTLLMIVDFVFGGTDYSNKLMDVKRNIGDHIIKFCFEFDGEKFFFSRSYNDFKRIYRCNKEYEKENEITLSEYTEWLGNKYRVNIKDLSFRDLIGRFFRIYGKENLNEKQPLEVAHKEAPRKGVNALLKIMNYYNDIKKFEKIYEEKDEKLNIFRKAQQYDFIPQKVGSRELKKMQTNLNRLQEEMDVIEKQTAWNISDLETEKIDSIIRLKQDLSNAKRQKTRYESQLNSLENFSDSQDSINQYDLSVLQEYFPNINIRELTEIQEFHKKLSAILSREIDNEKLSLKQLILSADLIIKEILDSMEDIGKASNTSSIILKKYAELQSLSKDLKNKIIANNKLTSLNEEKQAALSQYQEIKMEKIKNLSEVLNDKMNEINDFIYDGKKKPPVFSFKEKSYNFYTYDDTGTGTSFKSLIIYDLSILGITVLPALVHDSCLLKQIADIPLEKLLQLYQKSSKQIFIALDKMNSYTPEAQKILNSNKIIELSSNGKELFGSTWSNK
ncbi:hypothetical protein II898_03320 [bacterium]|nr:hypothetical protein [bacterium]